MPTAKRSHYAVANAIHEIYRDWGLTECLKALVDNVEADVDNDDPNDVAEVQRVSRIILNIIDSIEN